MINIDNEFIVEASTHEIWEVITQTDKYGEWNSFVSQCQSTLKVGDPIIMRVHLLPFPITQKETILEYQPKKILTYGVNIPFNILKSSRQHSTEMLDNGKVRYRSHFKIEGLLAPLVKLIMLHKLEQGFSCMSQEMHDEILRRQTNTL